MTSRTIRHVATRFGDIAYAESGEGPPALFVHGVFVSGYLWRHVIDRVGDLRRCIAIDILVHGQTRTAPAPDLSFATQAEMLAAVCDALGLGMIDLVGNDSGGAIAQIFAARHGDRLRSLTLTDCDVHDGWPPPELQPLIQANAAGQLGALGQRMLADPDFARQALAGAYEHPEQVSVETIRAYLAPVFGTPERTRLFEQLFADCFAANDPGQLVAIEPALRALAVPTLIVWGTADPFFGVCWAEWLAETIPGARPPVLLAGAKLFFPEERPDDLARALREHWSGTGS